MFLLRDLVHRSVVMGCVLTRCEISCSVFIAMAKAPVLEEVPHELAKAVVDVILNDSGQKKCKELCQSLLGLLDEKPQCAPVVADAFRGHKQNNYLRMPLERLKKWTGPESASLDNMPWKALQKKLETCLGTADDLKDLIVEHNNEPVVILQKVVGRIFRAGNLKHKLTQIWKRAEHTTACPSIDGVFDSSYGPLVNSSGLKAFAKELYPCEFAKHIELLQKLAQRLTDTPPQLRSKHGEMILDTKSVPIIRLDDEPWFCVTPMIEGMGYSAAQHYTMDSFVPYATQVGLRFVNCKLSTCKGSPVEASEGTIEGHFDDEVEQYERDIAAQSKGLRWMSCPYNNGRPVLFGDFPVLVLLLNRLKTRKARQFRAAALEQSMLVMSGSERVATSLAQYWTEQRMSKPDNILLQYLGAVGEHMETQHSVQPPSHDKLKLEIELDILRSKQKQEAERAKREQARTALVIKFTQEVALKIKQESAKREEDRTRTVAHVEARKRESEVEMIDMDVKRRRVEVTAANRSQNPDLTRDFESAEADNRNEIHLSDVLKKHLVINSLNLQSAVSSMARLAPIAIDMEAKRRPDLILGSRTAHFVDVNGAARQNDGEKDYREKHLPALIACLHVMVIKKNFSWKHNTPVNLSDFWLENLRHL